MDPEGSPGGQSRPSWHLSSAITRMLGAKCTPEAQTDGSGDNSSGKGAPQGPSLSVWSPLG